MAPRLRALMLLALSALLPGCSTLSIVYNQADTVLAWVADDYFDLKSEQKDLLRRDLHRLHAWHRADQLPDYATLLESTRARYANGLSLDDTEWVTEALRARFRVLVTRWHGEAARHLARLSDDQLAATRRQFERANRKFARENALDGSPEDQRRARLKRTHERIEHWTGPLTPEQETRLAELSNALPMVAGMRQQYRQRRQQEFLALMAQRQDAAFPQRLRDWLIAWEGSRSPEYEAAQARFARGAQEMYVALDRTLTREQRERVANRMQRYADTFRQLAREATRSAAASPAQ